jgi:uncharacterized protein (DUF952 family)
MSVTYQFVYKVLPRAAWEAACRAGAYEGSADDVRDGFIHLSRAEQLPGTLAKHFRGQEDLLVIQFETQALGAALRWEVARRGQEFPHLYAPLPAALAVAVHDLELDVDGVPRLPAEFAAC